MSRDRVRLPNRENWPATIVGTSHNLRMVKFAMVAALALPGWAAVTGEDVYKSRCGSCHDNGESRAPVRAVLAKLSAGRIRRTLDSGVMMPIASALTAEER